MPAVEIVIFPAAEPLIADISKAQETLDIVAKAEGFLGVYGGIQVEDKKTAYFAVVWSSYEDHKKFRADTENHGKFSASFKQHLAGVPTLEFVQFGTDHTTAFSAPVTEVVVINKLKEGKTKEDFGASVAGLVEALKDAEGLHLPGANGEVIGKPGKFYLFAGWDSIEAHKAAVEKEQVRSAVGNFLGLVDGSVGHVAFQKFAFA